MRAPCGEAGPPSVDRCGSNWRHFPKVKLSLFFFLSLSFPPPIAGRHATNGASKKGGKRGRKGLETNIIRRISQKRERKG